MKRNKKLYLIVILILFSAKIFAADDEYKLTNVKKEYIGTYIPVDLELRLYQSKKFYESLYVSRNYGKTRPHDILYLHEDKCYSDVAFHDGYAIENEAFKNYKFLVDKNNVFCIDDNGYLYRKITNESHGAKEYVEYVMKILFFNYQNSSEIKINGNLITINGTEYAVILDGNFFSTTDAVIWFYSDKNYVLIKNGNDGELFSGKDDDNYFITTKDELITRFPGMFEIKQSDLPDYSLVSKKILRILRNLIFARNGYIFKSKDLDNYFKSFSWYKPNRNFNENNLRKDEKDFISLMQFYEGNN